MGTHHCRDGTRGAAPGTPGSAWEFQFISTQEDGTLFISVVQRLINNSICMVSSLITEKLLWCRRVGVLAVRWEGSCPLACCCCLLKTRALSLLGPLLTIPKEKLFHKSSISLRRGKKLSVNQMRAFSVPIPPSPRHLIPLHYRNKIQRNRFPKRKRRRIKVFYYRPLSLALIKKPNSSSERKRLANATGLAVMLNFGGDRKQTLSASKHRV
ncbi:uncharacterized protein LOC131583682 [Poecile atricapillus]|uniref:uncharacterized protein LOC131583682 n=1 Tax=Poecile atricapillus TaxID=48891 RepID=UPI002739549B|nr:uncharacterized protein LOC131583682 [Poecile atricapillus]